MATIEDILFYNIFIGLSLFTYAIYNESCINYKLWNKILLIVSFCTLWLILSLRFQVGIDYKSYVDIFYEIRSSGTPLKPIEPLYLFLNQIFSFSYFGFVWVFLIVAFLTIYFLFEAIEEVSTNRVLSLIVALCGGFYFFSFNVMRQALAIAIVLYASKYLIQNKFWKFLFFVLIASSMHFSALLFVPFYFISKIRIKFYAWVGLFIGVIILYKISFITWLMYETFNLFLPPAYSHYVGSIYDRPAEINTGLTYIFNFSIGIMLILYYNTFLEKLPKYIPLINLYLFSLLLTILFQEVWILGRFTYNFSFFIILVIPLLLELFHEKSRIYVFALITTIFIIFFERDLYISSHGVVPYNSIFQINFF